MRNLILLINLTLGLMSYGQEVYIDKGLQAFETGNKAYLEEDYASAIKA